jgi:hypothetical protein
MPNFTAGTSFGVNDTVTNTKLNALIADATINPECALSINSGTIGTLSCTRGTIGTFNSTTGTVATLNTTTGSVQTLSAGTLATNLTGGTYSGSIGTARSLTAGTIQTLTASTLTGTLTGGTYSGVITGSLGTSCNFTAGTINRLTSSSNATISGCTVGTIGASLAFSNNVFGFDSLPDITTGNHNTCVGYIAGSDITTGSFNSIFGSNSLYTNKSGSDNSTFGYSSLFSSGTATSRNSAFGSNTLYTSTGSANTAVGYNALNSNSSYVNSTGIGANAAVTASNQVQAGDSATTLYYYAIQSRSDIRDKADVKDTNLGLQFIKELRPVDFKWDMREDYKPSFDKDANPEIYKLSNITHDGSKKRNRYHHGLIAQEVKEVLDRNGIDFGGFQDHKISGGDDVLSIGYTELIAPMIKAIQQLSAKVDSLEAQLASK